MRLAERACYILRQRLGPTAEDKVKDIDYNDPQRVHAVLKTEFEPDTPANRLDKLSKFMSALQSTGESTTRFGGRVRSLLRDWTELWPSTYTLTTLKEELWMHVVLRGLTPGFQHIRNGYAGAEKQDVATLDRLLDSNDALDTPSSSQLAFAARTPPSIVAGRLLRPRPASPFDCLWCETNGGHFTEECRNLQRSREQRKANRTQPKASTGKGTPQQAKAADSTPTAEFAGEASRLFSPSDLTTNDYWNPDTGATCHMTVHKEWLTHYRPHRVPVRLGDNRIVWSEGVGVCWFEPLLEGIPAPLVRFSNVLYVPMLASNLLSLFSLTALGYSFTGTGRSLTFTKDGQVLFQAAVSGKRIGHLLGRSLPAIQAPQAAFAAAVAPLTLQLWHERLNHRSLDAVERAVQHVEGLTIDSRTRSLHRCPSCAAGKHHRDPFPASSSRATRALELVHTDLSGPARVPGTGGVVYRLTITDDYTRWRWLRLLTNKREETILDAFKEYKAMAEAQHPSCKLVTIRDDKGAEFIGNRIAAWRREHGIQAQHTVRATPQQNGRAERGFRDLGESATCLLARAGMPVSWWAEAAHAANYVYNRLPHSSTGCSPCELWYGRKPNVANLRVWGCLAYVHLQKDQRVEPKHGTHSRPCTFIGYRDDYKGWEFLDHETGERVISRDVLWQENAFRNAPWIPWPEQHHPLAVPAPPPAPLPAPAMPELDEDVLEWGGADLPALPVPPAPAASPAPPALAAPPAPLQDLPPHLPPAALLPQPGPPEPIRRSTRQRFQPRPFWVSNAPLIPHNQPAPAQADPSEPIVSDQEPYQDEPSDSEEQEAEIAAQVWGSVLEGVGIHPDFVEMEIGDVYELAFSAAQQACAAVSDLPVPRTYKQAMVSPQKEHWNAACDQEAHMENGTWRLVKLPEGRTPVGSRWVFHIKRTADGSIERYKARMVAQGFSQRPGWDYVESFAPTIRLSVVRALFALVAADDLECDSIDITTAFLNGDLEEEIYMKPPEGYEQYSKDGQLLYCLLLKALYGLKQGGHQWYLKLSSVMKEIGFRKVRSEPCVYVWESSSGEKVIVPTYVDDCHIIGKSKDSIQHTKAQLQKHFKLRDLGPTNWFLGMDIKRDRSKHTLTLSQRQYIVDMLKDFGMEDCAPVKTPMVPGLRLEKPTSPLSAEETDFMKDKPYLRAIGKLTWLANGTRPDIAYAAGVLARFNNCPGRAQWTAVKHLLRYLKGTIDYKLHYGSTPHPAAFASFSDADFAGDADSAKSTTGFVLLMGGGAVSWSSKLQSCVSRSTTEAEFIAGESCSREMAFFRYILEDLGYKVATPQALGMDNQSAIRVAKNPEHQGRMKHLNPIYYGFREQVEAKEVAPYFVPTADMPADILTKALTREQVEKCVSFLGLQL
jgi:transposase InsO family protein